MLELKNITKKYKTGDLVQRALDDVSLSFRNSEFVAVLGPSGSGKTTLLNIIGGLDRYDSGDLVINSVSTKKYSDRDWDSYRNHTIGFVFQNYNLIPHQSVLSNVELALTISGVSRSERRKRAKAALESVGLGDQMHKRPNQMSGGQMQRVAIARALINDPDVLLADEPTGALDSETSLQVMNLLKEVAKDRLVIMVTHNAELANEYANRIVRLRDGRIIDDSNPVGEAETVSAVKAQTDRAKMGKTTMSFFTALSLSLNNLRTKKGRTILTAFAGSIGIIGIAMILALSTGIRNYVNSVQEETLSSYPVVVEKTPNNILKSLASIRSNDNDDEKERDENTVYSNPRIYRMFNAAFTGSGEENDLVPFKAFFEEKLKLCSDDNGLSDIVKAVHYDYGVKINAFFEGTDGSYINADISKAMFGDDRDSENTGMSMFNMVSSRMPTMTLWSELMPGMNGQTIDPMLTEQYDLVCGTWPEEAEEIVLILTEKNEITDNAFFALGLIPQDEVDSMLRSVLKGEEIEEVERCAAYEDIIGKEFRVVATVDMYKKAEDISGKWDYIGDDASALDIVIRNGIPLKIVGIIRPNSGSSLQISGCFGYTVKLSQRLIQMTAESDLITNQLSAENENFDLISGLPFVLDDEDIPSDPEKAELIKAYFAEMNDAQKVDTYIRILAIPDEKTLNESVEGYMAMYPAREDMIGLAASAFGFSTEEMSEYLSDYSDEELTELIRKQVVELMTARYEENARMQVMAIIAQNTQPGDIFNISGYHAVAELFDSTITAETDIGKLALYYDKFMPASVSGSTLDDRLDELGYIDGDTPESITIYVSSFDDKEKITDTIDEYNSSVENEEQLIEYTDYVALLMSGVTTIIDAVSYGLIAFVTISLVVSSIMIGIITYISVLERTKEIGILRSIGASKHNIRSVFNAETLIIGFFAGIIGIVITVLLCIPLNIILHKLTGIQSINAFLPLKAAAILILISMFLTLISGLIPAGIAARKDPVTALRTE